MDTIKVKDLQIVKIVLENKLKNYFGNGQQDQNDKGFKMISEQLVKVNDLLKIGKDVQVDHNGDVLKERVKRKYVKRT